MFIRVEHDSRSEHLNKYLDLGYPWVGMLNNMGKHFYSFKNLSFLCLVAFILTKSPVNPSLISETFEFLGLGVWKNTYEWLQTLPMQQPEVELELGSECITESFMQNFSKADVDFGAKSPLGQLCMKSELNMLLPVVSDWTKARTALDKDGDMCLSPFEICDYFYRVCE